MKWLHENFSDRRLRGAFGGAKCDGAGCTWTVTYVNDVSSVFPLMEMHLKKGHTLSSERRQILRVLEEREQFLRDIDYEESVVSADDEHVKEKLARLIVERRHWMSEIALLKGILKGADRE